jgi:hypothetical protein
MRYLSANVNWKFRSKQLLFLSIDEINIIFVSILEALIVQGSACTLDFVTDWMI